VGTARFIIRYTSDIPLHSIIGYIVVFGICLSTAALLFFTSKYSMYFGKIIIFLAVVMFPFFPIMDWLYLSNIQKILVIGIILLWEAYWIGVFYVLEKAKPFLK